MGSSGGGDTATSASSSGRLWVLAAALLWSLGGVFAKSLALDGPTIAFYRGLCAGLILLPCAPRSRRVFRPSLIPLGLTFGAMTGLYLAAIKATTAANAIFLQYTATFWTIPLSALVLRERPERRAVLAVGVAMLGIAVIVRYGSDGRPHEARGIALGLASGLGYAAVIVGLRGLRDLDPTWINAIANLVGALALGAWIGLARGAIVRPDATQAAALVVLGAVQMALPYVLFARGLRTVRAPEAGLIALVEPVLNPLWVFLKTGEQPTTATLVGGLILLAGIAFQYGPVRTATHDA